MTKQVRAPRPPEVLLPALRAAGPADRPETDGDYDGIEFADAAWPGLRARGATFLECAIRRCAFDEADLRRARLTGTVLEGVRGVGVRMSEAVLRDAELLQARFGGIQLGGAELNRVLIRGGKIDYLNLRQARLTDVTFQDCLLAEPDFAGARLERVAFVDCELRGADFSRAVLRDTDLRAATRLEITRGVDRLGGAVITPAQLLDLAPALAGQLGIVIHP